VERAIPCERVEWDRVEDFIALLARRIRADGFAPDLIVAIARGGFVPARLLADHLDVFDGETFELALSHIRSKGEPAQLRTAALHHKETSSYRPHFHAGRLEQWRWLIYPWAVMEDLRSLFEAMQPRPATPEEFARRLEKDHGIRFPLVTIEDAMPSP